MRRGVSVAGMCAAACLGGTAAAAVAQEPQGRAPQAQAQAPPAPASQRAASQARAAQAPTPPPPVATVAAATPLSGGGGWLVWSAPQGSQYVLIGYHEGRVRQLPIAPRAQPFDASVGSDAAGAPVVTFSRCARTPRMAAVGGDTPGGELLQPGTGAGCRVHLLALDGGAERALPIPAPAGASDTTPSMWRGTVTFARRSPAHGAVWRIMTWSPRRPRTLLILPHGRVPAQCPKHEAGCREEAVSAEVNALDRNGSVIAFLWSVSTARLGPHAIEEARVDRVDGYQAALAEANFHGEACLGPLPPRTLEAVDWEPPIASGREALLPELDDFSCFTGFASTLVAHGDVRGPASRGVLGAVALAVAQDGAQLYGLVPPGGEAWNVTDGPYCTAASPCAIEPLPAPKLRRDARTPLPPSSL